MADLPGYRKQGHLESLNVGAVFFATGWPGNVDMLNLAAPEEFQGQSYVPFLDGENTWEKPVVVECVAGCTNPYRPETRIGPRLLAIRDARYKLVIHFSDKREELFDLQSDPGERSPLPLGEQPDIRRRLLLRARKHLQNSISQRDLGTRLRTYLREQSFLWSGPVEAHAVHPFLAD